MSSTPERVPRLRTHGLTKQFGARAVLSGVDLHVEAGEVVLLAGGNGSGKTTLLRCVAGLARHQGHVELDGQVVRLGTTAARRIGYLPQALGLPAWATGAELLTLFGRLRGRDGHAPSGGTPSAATASHAALASELGLPDGFLPSLDQPLGRLSGGQRQRLAFTIALLGAPSLLLLDEPAANLDEDGRAAMVEILQAVRVAGVGVLVAAPSPGDLNGLPDRTVRLAEGVVRNTERMEVPL